MAHEAMAYPVMAHVVLSHAVMAHIGLPHVVMAHIVLPHVVMALFFSACFALMSAPLTTALAGSEERSAAPDGATSSLGMEAGRPRGPVSRHIGPRSAHGGPAGPGRSGSAEPADRSASLCEWTVGGDALWYRELEQRRRKKIGR